MNLAIIISVSVYDNIQSLPACKYDADAMGAIFEGEAKYDEVLTIDGSQPAAGVKSRIIDFVNAHCQNPVEEVVLYYSGHGEYAGGEFYYLMRDYDPSQRRQTSLENSEIDKLLKLLQPKLAVKIIDSCSSGMSYVKEPESFANHIKGTQKLFDKCYFLFSSQSDQGSYQNNSISEFTKAVAEAVLSHKSKDVRFKDVIDYVSDYFEHNEDQRPLFVSQAVFTELFCTPTPSLRSSLRRILGSPEEPLDSVAKQSSTAELIALIARDAKRYCTKDEALQAVDVLRTKIEQCPISSTLDRALIAGLFEPCPEFGNEFRELPDTSTIGRWLDDHKFEFFARPYRRGHPDYDEEDAIYGFRPTMEMPFIRARYEAKPKFPNLRPATCFIVPFLSRTELVVFSVFARYEYTGWDDVMGKEFTRWQFEQLGLREHDRIRTYLDGLFDQFWDFAMAAVFEAFKPQELTSSGVG